MQTDKTGIYIDCKQLHYLLYQAQFTMTKADRIILGSDMLNCNRRLFGHLAMAVNLEDRRLEMIDTFIADFEALKIDLDMAVEYNIIKEKTSTVDKAAGAKVKPESLKIQIFECVARIDKGINKWRSKTKAREGAKERLSV